MMQKPVEKILSKAEIREWFKKYQAIPVLRRFMTVRQIAKELNYHDVHLHNVMHGKEPIAVRFQVKFTRFVNKYGYPHALEHIVKQVKPVPERIYVNFATHVALLDADTAAYYGINKNTYLLCKNGAVPAFQKKTLTRLYKEITGEEFVY